MFEWEDYRWIIYAGIIIVMIILLDEWGYTSWKKQNPGAMYSHLNDRPNLTILDPSSPPTTIYYG